MKKIMLLIGILVFFMPLASIAREEGVKIPKVKIDMSDEAIERGKEVFMTTCNNCHGLKYLGYQARTPAEVVTKAFGSEPVDLSLIAKARGRGDKGARYIYALLTSYNSTPEKNSVFPNIAMPPVFSKKDPQLEQKAKDISAFLLYAAEPTAAERKRLGRYVLGYMVILTALLYALNKRTWKDVKKKKG
jgi:cytochrome c1